MGWGPPLATRWSPRSIHSRPRVGASRTRACQGVRVRGDDTIPASLLTFSTINIHPSYGDASFAYGLDPVTDQNVAGLIMKLAGDSSCGVGSSSSGSSGRTANNPPTSKHNADLWLSSAPFISRAGHPVRMTDRLTPRPVTRTRRLPRGRRVIKTSDDTAYGTADRFWIGSEAWTSRRACFLSADGSRCVHDDGDSDQADGGTDDVVSVRSESVEEGTPGEGSGDEHPSIGGEDPTEVWEGLESGDEAVEAESEETRSHEDQAAFVAYALPDQPGATDLSDCGDQEEADGDEDGHLITPYVEWVQVLNWGFEGGVDVGRRADRRRVTQAGGRDL